MQISNALPPSPAHPCTNLLAVFASINLAVICMNVVGNHFRILSASLLAPVRKLYVDPTKPPFPFLRDSHLANFAKSYTARLYYSSLDEAIETCTTESVESYFGSSFTTCNGKFRGGPLFMATGKENCLNLCSRKEAKPSRGWVALPFPRSTR